MRPAIGIRNAVGPLSEAAECRLLSRMVAADDDARCRVIEAYLGMVSGLARRYAKRWKVPSEDKIEPPFWLLLRFACN